MRSLRLMPMAASAKHGGAPDRRVRAPSLDTFIGIGAGDPMRRGTDAPGPPVEAGGPEPTPPQVQGPEPPAVTRPPAPTRRPEVGPLHRLHGLLQRRHHLTQALRVEGACTVRDDGG